MPRPDPPANVVATQGDPEVVITWDAVTNARSYTIQRALSLTGQGYVIGITDELSWTDSTALTDVGYWYSVSVRTGDGCSATSGRVYGYASAAPVSVPDAPTNLMGTVEY